MKENEATHVKLKYKNSQIRYFTFRSYIAHFDILGVKLQKMVYFRYQRDHYLILLQPLIKNQLAKQTAKKQMKLKPEIYK